MHLVIAEAGGQLTIRQAVLDGEIVALDACGQASFQALQHRGSSPQRTIVFYAFDVLLLDGANLMAERLTTRRAKLANVIGKLFTAARLSLDLSGSGDDIVNAPLLPLPLKLTAIPCRPLVLKLSGLCDSSAALPPKGQALTAK